MKNNKPDTSSDSTPRPAKRRLSTRLRLAMAGLVTATVATGLVVASADISSAGSTTDDSWRDSTTVTFRESMKPWDTVTIPTSVCQTGFFIDHDYSPGRLVPKGVEITGDSGYIGTTISHTRTAAFETEQGYVRAYYATDADKGVSTATNWDPFSSHELVVQIHCTLNPAKASLSPLIPGFGNTP